MGELVAKYVFGELTLGELWGLIIEELQQQIDARKAGLHIRVS